MNPPDGFLLVFSVVDRASFQRVESELRKLQEMDLIRTKAVVIVGNKIDLARSRSVSAQGNNKLMPILFCTVHSITLNNSDFEFIFKMDVVWQYPIVQNLLRYRLGLTITLTNFWLDFCIKLD